jgi:glucose-6-phosphate 1-dehydrogenase
LSTATPADIVIFGATGDLAQRMLFPSLYFLDVEERLAPGLRIIGAARSDMDDQAFVAKVEETVRERADGYFDEAAWERFRPRLSYAMVDAGKPDTFDALKGKIGEAEERIFYLSTSPDLYAEISANLKRAGLIGSRARVVVEKPLGRDLQSARTINDALADAFGEDHVFRIDHYLGKETVQNLLALRFANAFFEPLWNSQTIAQVQITVAETVGLEGRNAYYDHYGALRDMVQNHVLQLLCLVAMEPPASLDPDSVRNEKVKVLRSLRPIEGRELEKRTVRGQYRRGVADDAPAPGYVEEGGGADTETFVALQANIDNWRWAGVPFYLRTGKRMALRRTEVVILFKDVPHSIFGGEDLLANRLTIRLQPEEDISLLLMNKTPSLEERGMELKPVALSLSLYDAFKTERPRRRIAYERLLLAALNDDPTLFVRRDEVEAAWAWVDGVEAGWKKQGVAPAPYNAGSWGPSGAFALTERNGHSWYE